MLIVYSYKKLTRRRPLYEDALSDVKMNTIVSEDSKYLGVRGEERRGAGCEESCVNCE